jgi:hypothetical protein
MPLSETGTRLKKTGSGHARFPVAKIVPDDEAMPEISQMSFAFMEQREKSAIGGQFRSFGSSGVKLLSSSACATR